jgi:polyhydroxybutyrate depolymerase
METEIVAIFSGSNASRSRPWRGTLSSIGGRAMHTSFTAWSFASLVIGSALHVVACGNNEADGSEGVAGSLPTSSGGTADASGGSGASIASGGAGNTGSGGTSIASGGTEGIGGTSVFSGGAGNTGSGGTSIASGGSGGTAGGANGGSTSNGGMAGSAQGGAMSADGGAGTTGGSPMTGGGGSSMAGSGASGGTAGAGGSGGDATGGGSGGAAGGSGGLTNPVPSEGCGMVPPADGQDTIDVGDTTREYILRLPEGYDGTTPNRIIFAFHGAAGSAVQVDNGDPPRDGLDPTGPYFGIRDEADNQTIFVAGQALSGGWSSSDERDLDYVRAMLDRFESELCIDESRIFATGFSMGAIMSITVACNLSDIFRAVAPMSGSLQNGCPEGGQHIGYWASHGTSDTTIAISQGEAARDEFVQRNHCQTDAMPTEPDGCVTYQGCDSGYPVDWCPFDGAHEPPPFSGSAIWAFLSQF